MSELGATLHPLAADIGVLTDAMQQGIAEELPFWGILKGFDVNVLPAGVQEDGTTYLRLEPIGGKSLIEYQLAPPSDMSNPLYVVEADEQGDIYSKPVLARMVVTSGVLLMPIGTRGGLPLKASQIQVDILEGGAVISLNDSLGIDPIFGEYDDGAYGFIRKKSYEELRLGYLAGFAREYLAA